MNWLRSWQTWLRKIIFLYCKCTNLRWNINDSNSNSKASTLNVTSHTCFVISCLSPPCHLIWFKKKYLCLWKYSSYNLRSKERWVTLDYRPNNNIQKWWKFPTFLFLFLENLLYRKPMGLHYWNIIVMCHLAFHNYFDLSHIASLFWYMFSSFTLSFKRETVSYSLFCRIQKSDLTSCILFGCLLSWACSPVCFFLISVLSSPQGSHKCFYCYMLCQQIICGTK